MSCTICGLPALDLARLAKKLKQGANLMVGQPDYEAYAAHRQAQHPGAPIMTREEFFFDRQARRFGDARGFRCC